MTTHHLAIIGGDGVGPEVTAQALKVLDAAEQRFGFSTTRTEYDLGGRRYLASGEVLPDSVMAELDEADAILLGAVGTPEVPPGVLERGLLLKLRFAFDQFVNLRPVKLLPGVPTPIAGLTPDRCDMVIVRENTEGMYVGAGGSLFHGTGAEVATQESLNTRHGVERVIRDAFARARNRRNHLTLVHKTNVLNFAGDLWMRTFTEVGDDVADLGAAVQGGLGLAASGNLNPTGAHPSMFEPVHGSAPDIAGKGWANPVAAVLSLSMALDHLDHADAARAVEDAAAEVLTTMTAMGGPDMGGSTDELGDRIAAIVAG